jgi:hypothetical protein
MPTPMIKSFAQKANKSVDSVESLWSEIIATVKKEYNVKDGDEKLYKIATTILKKRLKLEQNYLMRFAEFYRGLYVK